MDEKSDGEKLIAGLRSLGGHWIGPEDRVENRHALGVAAVKAVIEDELKKVRLESEYIWNGYALRDLAVRRIAERVVKAYLSEV